MTKKIVLIILCFSLPLIAVGCEKNTAPTEQKTILRGSPRTISIGSKQLQVELMDTPSLMQQGLSGRDELPLGQGMIFDFTQSANKQPGFWMSEMRFDIDMIWIRDSRVIGVTPNVPQPKGKEQLPIYYPPGNVDYVLEVPAGWSAANNITTDSPFIFITAQP
jgi:uncharacterized membrane protein (UPF0127 family)